MAERSGPAKRKAGGADDTAPLSYEQARAELESVVQRLEGGGTTLEEALALWERGEELGRVCLNLLDAARARLDAGDEGSVAGERRGNETESRPPALGPDGTAEAGP